jgi:hypothetical protein
MSRARTDGKDTTKLSNEFDAIKARLDGRHLDRKTLVVTQWGIHDEEAHAALKTKTPRHFLSYSEKEK